MTPAFDKRDYHIDAALQAGKPEEHAFTHIGLYLAWVVRHDLHNHEFIGDQWAKALAGGEMNGSDLADAIDGKLTSDLLTARGAAFTAARYAHYLEKYSDVFAADGDYGVADTAESYARIAPLIDDLYTEWVASGQPEPDPKAPDESREGASLLVLPHESVPEDLHAWARAQGWEVTEMMATRRPEDMPHRAPELEALIPRDIAQPPIVTSSVHAGEWGDALLQRVLKRLKIEPRAALVANAIGGAGADTVTVTLYEVLGVPADRLEREFASVIFLPPRLAWGPRMVGRKRVNWAATPEFHAAFWASDGLAVHASASDEGRLERLVLRLP